jgi:hypothetical protein
VIVSAVTFICRNRLSHSLGDFPGFASKCFLAATNMHDDTALMSFLVHELLLFLILMGLRCIQAITWVTSGALCSKNVSASSMAAAQMSEMRASSLPMVDELGDMGEGSLDR